MLKRMFLSALLAATAVPALAADASYDVRTLSAQAATNPTAKGADPAKPVGAAKHDCSCAGNHHHG